MTIRRKNVLILSPRVGARSLLTNCSHKWLAIISIFAGTTSGTFCHAGAVRRGAKKTFMTGIEASIVRITSRHTFFKTRGSFFNALSVSRIVDLWIFAEAERMSTVLTTIWAIIETWTRTHASFEILH